MIVHAVGECEGDDLLEQVQEFTRRACNAFLHEFPNGTPRHAHGLRVVHHPRPVAAARHQEDAGTLLSLHSLERQRSDMTSEISQEIEEIELSGLREARSVLVHDPATAAAVRSCVPEAPTVS